jgi:hypothetical protein
LTSDDLCRQHLHRGIIPPGRIAPAVTLSRQEAGSASRKEVSQ